MKNNTTSVILKNQITVAWIEAFLNRKRKRIIIFVSREFQNNFDANIESVK